MDKVKADKIKADKVKAPVGTIDKARLYLEDVDSYEDFVESLESDIQNLSESLPILMVVLTEISDVHPYIAGKQYIFTFTHHYSSF